MLDNLFEDDIGDELESSLSYGWLYTIAQHDKAEGYKPDVSQASVNTFVIRLYERIVILQSISRT